MPKERFITPANYTGPYTPEQARELVNETDAWASDTPKPVIYIHPRFDARYQDCVFSVWNEDRQLVAQVLYDQLKDLYPQGEYDRKPVDWETTE